jgi:LacI family transcriptional regulator
MKHLVSAGCRRIVSVCGFYGVTEGDMRSTAYATVMEGAGLSAEYIVITNRHPREDCRAAVKEYIAEHGCPDAFFCRNDELALSTYKAVREMGFSVPGNVVISGCDGIQETEYVDTPISTIVQPVEEMCTQAWKLLQSRMDNPSLPGRQITLTAALVLRESTCR